MPHKPSEGQPKAWPIRTKAPELSWLNMRNREAGSQVRPPGVCLLGLCVAGKSALKLLTSVKSNVSRRPTVRNSYRVRRIMYILALSNM